MSETVEKRPMLGLSREDIKAALLTLGQPAYRGDQVFDWIWHKLVMDPAGMSNLPLELRRELADRFDWRMPRIAERHEDRDGTVKFAMGLMDGYRVEAVLIPRLEQDEAAGGGREKPGRTDCTLCLSTQVGCRFQCVFCRSGREGLVRNLRADEIAGQLPAVEQRLVPGERIRKLVLMGIGEPLDNYEETCRAVRIWLERKERALTGGRIVVSTVGIPEAIARLSRDLGGKVSLALSLHSPSAEKRSRIVRGAGRITPAELVEAARQFNFPPRERLTVEYVLVRGLNDSEADGRELARLLRGRDCMVNLIPLNPVKGLRFKPPSPDRAVAFQALLRQAGIMAFIRRRRGSGVQGACGQLAFARE